MWDAARFSVCHVSASLYDLGTKAASGSVLCQTQAQSSPLHRGAVGSEHQRLPHRVLQRERTTDSLREARDVLAERSVLNSQQPLFQDDKGLLQGLSS